MLSLVLRPLRRQHNRWTAQLGPALAVLDLGPSKVSDFGRRDGAHVFDVVEPDAIDLLKRDDLDFPNFRQAQRGDFALTLPEQGKQLHDGAVVIVFEHGPDGPRHSFLGRVARDVLHIGSANDGQCGRPMAR